MERVPETKLESRVGVALFFALLWLPLALALLEPDAEVSLTEQRTLATLPGWNFDAARLADLPRALERYYDDRLGLRDDLIRAWAWLHIEGLGISPSESLVVGKSGWFFFGSADALDQYRGTARFRGPELAEWRRVLEGRRDWLAERGIAYLVVFVPNKHRVYAEYMPDALPRIAETSELDQLVSHLEATSDVPVLDLREALFRAKETERVYHKTDTHWNDVGAYAAYRAILSALEPRLPALRGRSPAPVRAAEHTKPGMGLPRIVGLSAAYPERSLDRVLVSPQAGIAAHRRIRHEERVRHQLPFALGTGDAELPTAVMFRDSFANTLIPYVSESFSRILYVWERDVDPRIVEIEQPDVVIQEIAERFVGRTPVAIEVVASRVR